MPTLTVHRTLAIAVLTLTLAAPAARAADVEIQLGAGDGFVIKDNTGAIERLRVDEDTGNISRNGALFVHTTGADNLFVGEDTPSPSTLTFLALTTGGNTALGERALQDLYTGFYNTAVGADALKDTDWGTKNVALGAQTLEANTYGQENTAVGFHALSSSTTGDNNIALGTNAGGGLVSGDDNIYLGSSAGSAYEDRTIRIGSSSYSYYTDTYIAGIRGKSLSSPYGILPQAVSINASGQLGTNRVSLHTGGSVGSLFLGYNTGNASVTGTNDNAVGRDALSSLTSGTSNNAFGENSLPSLTSGTFDNAFGGRALYAATTGNGNNAFGYKALYSATSGAQNTAVGHAALVSANSSQNTAVGWGSLLSDTSGGSNIALGYYAGKNQTTGSDNIYIANRGVAGESGKIKIGDTSHTETFIEGIHGNTATGGVAVLINSSNELHTIVSSERFKRDIHDMGDASDVLLELRPVTFHYREEVGSSEELEYGLIAEEVAEVAPDLVVRDEEGRPYSVRYHLLAPMLLNELQKERSAQQSLLAKVDELESELEQLRQGTNR